MALLAVLVAASFAILAMELGPRTHGNGYFEAVAQVIPVLLLALSVEASLLRRFLEYSLFAKNNRAGKNIGDVAFLVQTFLIATQALIPLVLGELLALWALATGRDVRLGSEGDALTGVAACLWGSCLRDGAACIDFQHLVLLKLPVGADVASSVRRTVGYPPAPLEQLTYV